jgi:lysophospholipase L1-like esterase
MPKLSTLQNQVARLSGLAAPTKAVFMGDSLTGTGRYGEYLCALHGGERLHTVFNAGVGGETTSQMLARFATSVIAYSPDAVFIMGGTNDTLQATAPTDAEFIGNIISMCQLAQENGIVPVVLLAAPAGSTDARKDTYGRYQQCLGITCQSLGILCYWGWDELTDPVSGFWASGANADDNHPTFLGYATFAKSIYAQMIGTKAKRSTLTALRPTMTYDIFGNGFMLDTDADGWADNVIFHGVQAANHTPSIVDDPKIKGKAQRVVISNITSTAEHGVALTAPTTPLDTEMLFGFDFNIESIDNCDVSFQLRFRDSSDSAGSGSTNTMRLQSTESGQFSIRRRTNPTSVRCQIRIIAKSIVTANPFSLDIRVGRVSMVNLDAMRAAGIPVA